MSGFLYFFTLRTSKALHQLQATTSATTSEAVQVLKALNKAVAVSSESSEEDVAQRFWQRLGVDILRGNYRAFIRRVEGGGSGAGLPDVYRGVGMLGFAVA